MNSNEIELDYSRTTAAGVERIEGGLEFDRLVPSLISCHSLPSLPPPFLVYLHVGECQDTLKERAVGRMVEQRAVERLWINPYGLRVASTGYGSMEPGVPL